MYLFIQGICAENNTHLHYWTQKSQFDAQPELPFLLTSIHGAGSYSSHYLGRKENHQYYPAKNPLTYNSDLPVRYLCRKLLLRWLLQCNFLILRTYHLTFPCSLLLKFLSNINYAWCIFRVLQVLLRKWEE